jgi:hypothetical protein
MTETKRLSRQGDPLSNTLSEPRPLVFLDTETTHLHPRLRRPWEIAMIRRPALPNNADRITMMITDVDLSDADPESLKIGRFYERHPLEHDRGAKMRELIDRSSLGSPAVRTLSARTSEAEVERILHRARGLVSTSAEGALETKYMSESEAAHVVEWWIRDAIVIGLVPDFDTYTLDPMLRRHGLLPRQYYHCIDVETEAAGWLRGRLHAGDPELVDRADEVLDALALPRKSDALSRLCGVEPPTDTERHTAMGDTAWDERWWDAITPALPQPGGIAA